MKPSYQKAQKLQYGNFSTNMILIPIRWGFVLSLLRTYLFMMVQLTASKLLKPSSSSMRTYTLHCLIYILSRQFTNGFLMFNAISRNDNIMKMHWKILISVFHNGVLLSSKLFSKWFIILIDESGRICPSKLQFIHIWNACSITISTRILGYLNQDPDNHFLNYRSLFLSRSMLCWQMQSLIMKFWIFYSV